MFPTKAVSPLYYPANKLYNSKEHTSFEVILLAFIPAKLFEGI